MKVKSINYIEINVEDNILQNFQNFNIKEFKNNIQKLIDSGFLTKQTEIKYIENSNSMGMNLKNDWLRFFLIVEPYLSSKEQKDEWALLFRELAENKIISNNIKDNIRQLFSTKEFLFNSGIYSKVMADLAILDQKILSDTITKNEMQLLVKIVKDLNSNTSENINEVSATLLNSVYNSIPNLLDSVLSGKYIELYGESTLDTLFTSGRVKVSQEFKSIMDFCQLPVVKRFNYKLNFKSAVSLYFLLKHKKVWAEKLVYEYNKSRQLREKIGYFEDVFNHIPKSVSDIALLLKDSTFIEENKCEIKKDALLSLKDKKWLVEVMEKFDYYTPDFFKKIQNVKCNDNTLFLLEYDNEKNKYFLNNQQLTLEFVLGSMYADDDIICVIDWLSKNKFDFSNIKNFTYNPNNILENLDIERKQGQIYQCSGKVLSKLQEVGVKIDTLSGFREKFYNSDLLYKELSDEDSILLKDEAYAKSALLDEYANVSTVNNSVSKIMTRNNKIILKNIRDEDYKMIDKEGVPLWFKAPEKVSIDIDIAQCTDSGLSYTAYHIVNGTLGNAVPAYINKNTRFHNLDKENNNIFHYAFSSNKFKFPGDLINEPSLSDGKGIGTMLNEKNIHGVTPLDILAKIPENKVSFINYDAILVYILTNIDTYDLKFTPDQFDILEKLLLRHETKQLFLKVKNDIDISFQKKILLENDYNILKPSNKMKI